MNEWCHLFFITNIVPLYQQIKTNIMASGEVEAISNIPEEIECPLCKGAGYMQEDEQNEQCEECEGEGRIVIAEYAQEHGQTLADAYQTILSRNSGNPEE